MRRLLRAQSKKRLDTIKEAGYESSRITKSVRSGIGDLVAGPHVESLTRHNVPED
jgi:hypothetical protein